MAKKFYLQKGNRYLATGDTFTAPTMGDEKAVAFDSEDAALDKAEALGLDLDRIYVTKRTVEEKPKS
jgi:hypothetical protein